MLRKWRREAGLILPLGLILAMVAVAGFTTTGALAKDYQSGDKMEGPGANTLAWTGQGGGSDFKVQCSGDTAAPGSLLWIFTMGGGSVSDTPSLKVNNTVYNSTWNPGGGGEWHFITGWYTTSHPPTNAVVSFNVSDPGHGAWNLVISHGCPPANPEKKPVTVTTTVFDATTNAAWAGTEKAGAGAYDTARVVPPSALPVPTGTVTYIFYKTANCVAPNALGVDHLVVTLLGNGAVPNSMVKSNLGAGDYSFKALYSGDGNYKSAASDCEPFAVKKADPSITTSQDPSSAFIGATLTDSATLSAGFNPTGTITFTLKNPSNTAVFTNTVPVSGNGTYLSTAAGTITGNNVAMVAGTYHWFASYGSDANNNVANSINDEPVVISQGEEPTIPTITTTQDPKSAVVGATLKDKATVTGIVSGTYTITFTLKDPNGTVAHTEDILNVTANGTYKTATGHVANSIGTWHWIAVLKDSQGTVVAQTGANDEPVTVAGGEVLAATAMTSPLQAFALGLIGIGLVAMMAALAVRRREA